MLKILKSLFRNKSFDIKAKGTSMLPILQSNDVVNYHKIIFKRTKVNDLIMIKKNGQMFTHRIVYKTDNYLVAKGDNNLESDGKIYPKQVIAKVIQVKRNGKLFDPESLYLLQSSLYFQEIVKIKKTFEREKIDFVFLKGLPLHLYFEKTHPRRIYADCDILISKNNLVIAHDIFVQSGYIKTAIPLANIGPVVKTTRAEISYLKKVNGYPIFFDVHTEIVFMITKIGNLNYLYPLTNIDQLTNDCLCNKYLVKIQDQIFPILSLENLILYLALHFFNHDYRGAFRLELMNKIIRLSHFRGGTWAGLTRKILNYKLQNFVYPVFVLLKKYYQTPIPQSFFKQIQPSTFQHQNLSSIFDNESRISTGITRFKNLFYLSPEPFWKKIFIFINPQVIYSIFWVFARKLSSFFSARRSIH